MMNFGDVVINFLTVTYETVKCGVLMIIITDTVMCYRRRLRDGKASFAYITVVFTKFYL